MRRLATAALAALISIDAAAFTGTGNDSFEDVQAYLSKSQTDYFGRGYWGGVVAGLSSVYADDYYRFAICYPGSATSGQLAEIAAKYVVDHPEKRHELVAQLVWLAHFEAFGLRSNPTCYEHDEWKARYYNHSRGIE